MISLFIFLFRCYLSHALSFPVCSVFFYLMPNYVAQNYPRNELASDNNRGVLGRLVSNMLFHKLTYIMYASIYQFAKSQHTKRLLLSTISHLTRLHPHQTQKC